METKTVWDKLNEGVYKSKLLYDIGSGSEEERRAMHRAYNTARLEVELEFKTDLFAYYGVSNNSKAEKAYSIAWEHGHSAGFHDVACFFGDIVELIK